MKANNNFKTLYEYLPLKENNKEISLENIMEKPDADNFEHFLKRKKLSKVFNITRNSICGQNYVGVIKYKKYQFEILPKLLTNKENDREGILKNLFYMLSFTKQLDIKDNDVAKLSKKNNPFLEVLIGIFANSLFDCLLRFIPKNYVLQEENLSYLKGKIKFNENIRYNTTNKARFYCEYDEFCEDNPLNQLFYYVCLMLSKISTFEKNRRTLKQILNIYSEVSFIPITKEKIQSLKLSRSQMSFDKPFKLAKMFIENSSVEMSSRKLNTIALVWDMNKLFEEFIYQFLRKNQSEFDGIKEITYQNNQYLIKSSKNLLNGECYNRSFKSTYTDILIKLKDRLIILDTKYKLNDGNRNEFKNADIYQLLAYKVIHERDNKNSKIHSVLAYPQCKEEPFAWKHYVEENKYVMLTCFDMREDLKKNPDVIINRIKEIIKWTDPHVRKAL
jgi:5-methylcytosine-specific restriction enzyme subunit McrC